MVVEEEAVMMMMKSVVVIVAMVVGVAAVVAAVMLMNVLQCWEASRWPFHLDSKHMVRLGWCAKAAASFVSADDLGLACARRTPRT